MKTLLFSLLLCFALTGCFENEPEEAVVPATNGQTCIQKLSELVNHEWKYVWIYSGKHDGSGVDMTGYNYTVRVTADSLFWNDDAPRKYSVSYANNYADMNVTNFNDDGLPLWSTTWNPVIVSCDTIEIWGNPALDAQYYEKLYVFVR